jgi:SAM-dependent methyltransferase
MVGMVGCKTCGLMFLNPRPSDAVLRSFYDDTYKEDVNYLEVSNHNIFLLRKILKLIESHKKTGKLLDIGCGTGTFLDLAKSRWEPHGIDVSPSSVEKAKGKYGLNIVCGELGEGFFPAKYFDVVVCLNTLEHIGGPVDFVREVRKILKDDGLFLVKVPDIDFYVSYPVSRLINILKKYYFGVIGKKPIFWGYRREHLYYYNRRTLALLLKSCGFKKTRAVSIRRSNFYEGILMLSYKKYVLFFASMLYFVVALLGFNREVIMIGYDD